MTVIVYRFCFWFSLRLGSILCAILCSLKAVCAVTISIALFQQDITKGHMGKVLLSVFNESIVDFAAKEMVFIFTFSILFPALYLLSCFLLIVGSILCKPGFCYPFLALNFTWCIADMINYIIVFKYLMTLTFIPADQLQTSMFGLGHVIVYLTLFLFYIMFEVYLGLCVYSFTQLVKVLRKELEQKQVSPVIKLIFKSGQIMEEEKVQNPSGYYF